MLPIQERSASPLRGGVSLPQPAPAHLVHTHRIRNVSPPSALRELELELPDLPASPRPATWEERFKRMYAAYHPEGLASVPLLLQASCGQEDVMLSALIQKYGPEPAPVQTLREGALLLHEGGVSSTAHRSCSSLSSSSATFAGSGPWAAESARRAVLRYAKAVLASAVQTGLGRAEAKAVISQTVSMFFATHSAFGAYEQGVLRTALEARVAEVRQQKHQEQQAQQQPSLAADVARFCERALRLRLAESGVDGAQHTQQQQEDAKAALMRVVTAFLSECVAFGEVEQRILGQQLQAEWQRCDEMAAAQKGQEQEEERAEPGEAEHPLHAEVLAFAHDVLGGHGHDSVIATIVPAFLADCRTFGEQEKMILERKLLTAAPPTLPEEDASATEILTYMCGDPSVSGAVTLLTQEETLGEERVRFLAKHILEHFTGALPGEQTSELLRVLAVQALQNHLAPQRRQERQEQEHQVDTTPYAVGTAVVVDSLGPGHIVHTSLHTTPPRIDIQLERGGVATMHSFADITILPQR